MKHKLWMTMYLQAALAVLSSLSVATAQQNPRNISDKDYLLDNGNLTFALTSPEEFRLKNKMTGKVYTGKQESFDLSLGVEDRVISLTGSDFARKSISQPSPGLLRMSYDGAGQLPGIRVEIEYQLSGDAWFVRKHFRFINETGKNVIIREINEVKCRIDGITPPEKPEKSNDPQNPLFLDDQLFWGLEWPIAGMTAKYGSFTLGHTPGVSVNEGDSWSGKVCGFGVSQAGRIKEAFGRYIQEIRANRVDFATFYFDWLCHDNSGPLESEILANFAALKKLKELYGLQFDIYNSDAGLVEAPKTYFPEYRRIFDKRFPNGLRTVADASAALGMSFGLWIGPDGFGESPAEMKARRDQLIAWVRDYNVGLFKLDTVVTPLAHKDKTILEKKYQSLADALAECRRINPSLVVINHRVNESPYMLTITDCLLWEGQETYIDVHIFNTTDSLYNRDCSINRPLTASFYDVPFRQFEDHGICFNSCIEKWDNDLVAQAFGRASVLSPEMYGTFFFLRDNDYPRLARLIQMHKQSEHLLKYSFPLPGDDVAHGDGNSTLVILRNPGWEPAVKSVRLDESIGLKTAAGTPVTVRQRHPHELLLNDGDKGFKAGDTLEVELDPYDLRMIQIDTGTPDEFFLGGIPYDVIPGSKAASFSIKLLGEPGRDYDVTFYNNKNRRFLLDNQPFTTPSEEKTCRLSFPGKPVKGPFFSVAGDCTDCRIDDEKGVRLAEFARFNIDDEALEARELQALEKQPSALPEIEACRDYMRTQIVDAEATYRNAFDGNPATRWSDGYPRRTEFANRSAPYRSESSLWRIDFGEAVPLARMELQIVRRTDSAFLESAEVSADLKQWSKIGDLSLNAAEKMPFDNEQTRRGKTTKFYDAAAGDGIPAVITINFPDNRSRYLRLHGRDFSVSEIAGYDREGKQLDRSKWRATNFYGEPEAPSRVLRLTHKLAEYWPGQEIAVSVRGGTNRLDAVDGVLAVVDVGGELFVPKHRAPSYPYHNYEANTSWLIRNRLNGMTFRLPTRREWAGKKMQVYVLLDAESADGASARVRIVTPAKPDAAKILSVQAP